MAEGQTPEERGREFHVAAADHQFVLQLRMRWMPDENRFASAHGADGLQVTPIPDSDSYEFMLLGDITVQEASWRLVHAAHIETSGLSDREVAIPSDEYGQEYDQLYERTDQRFSGPIQFDHVVAHLAARPVWEGEPLIAPTSFDLSLLPVMGNEISIRDLDVKIIAPVQRLSFDLADYEDLDDGNQQHLGIRTVEFSTPGDIPGLTVDGSSWSDYLVSGPTEWSSEQLETFVDAQSAAIALPSGYEVIEQPIEESVIEALQSEQLYGLMRLLGNGSNTAMAISLQPLADEGPPELPRPLSDASTVSASDLTWSQPEDRQLGKQLQLQSDSAISDPLPTEGVGQQRTGLPSTLGDRIPPGGAPPGIRAVALTAGVPPVDFTTLVGPDPSLRVLAANWASLLQDPTLLATSPQLNLLGVPSELDYPGRTIGVAEINHRQGQSRIVVDRMRVGLERLGIDGVVVEEGFFLRPATVPVSTAGIAPWRIGWDPNLTDVVRPGSRLMPPQGVLGAAHVAGWTPIRRVLVLDTGDQHAQTQFAINSENQGWEQPCDYHGHGTSVGSLIRLLAQGAEVHSYRVLASSAPVARPQDVLVAIATLPNEANPFNVVVLPMEVIPSVKDEPTWVGLDRILNDRALHYLPLIVCPAGNYGPRHMMGAALVRGLIVAVATDWTGRQADYNCPVPPGAPSPALMEALGGVAGTPLGTYSRDGRRHSCVGTSYAAAIIASGLAIA